MSNRKIAVLGGDMRQISMADALAESGRQVMLYGIDPSFAHHPPGRLIWADSPEEASRGAHTVILPLPCTVDHQHIHCPLGGADLSVDRLFACLEGCSLLLGGRLDEGIAARAKAMAIPALDYARSEEFAVRNALPTAEGALEIALNELPITIRSARFLVVGYGRVGEALAGILHALGASVSVCARRVEVRAKIQSAGMTALSPEEMAGRAFDGVFNTVPQPIIGERALSCWPQDILLVELASLPGGFDQTAVEKLGMHVIYAPGLPGKTAPVSAGKILAACVESLLKEVILHDDP